MITQAKWARLLLIVGGVLQVNVGARGTARLIMRNKGNFRLLLNASIWPGMKVTPMDGGKVGLLPADSPSQRTARPLSLLSSCAARGFQPAAQCQPVALHEGCPVTLHACPHP